MNLKKFVLPAVTALAWFSANNVRAQEAPPELRFTEISDTVLTVTKDGIPYGTVKNIGKDQWEWHSGLLTEFLPTAFTGLLPIQWREPEDDALVNTVTFGFFGLDIITLGLKPEQIGPELGAVIVSDTTPISGIPLLEDEEPTEGTVQLPGLTAIVVFDDLGDQQTGGGVPDSGPTSVLFLGASVALIGLSRLRSVRAA